MSVVLSWATGREVTSYIMLGYVGILVMPDTHAVWKPATDSASSSQRWLTWPPCGSKFSTIHRHLRVSLIYSEVRSPQDITRTIILPDNHLSRGQVNMERCYARFTSEPQGSYWRFQILRLELEYLTDPRSELPRAWVRLGGKFRSTQMGWSADDGQKSHSWRLYSRPSKYDTNVTLGSQVYYGAC